jgi:RNA polymerase sigma factor (sigma-70 family)
MISPEELDKEIEAFVAEHGKDLERYLRGNKIRLPSHLVGDVINDALLAVADKRRRGHTIDNPRFYLFRVARNAAIDRLKDQYATGIPDSRAIAEYQNRDDMLAHAEISHDLRIAIRRLAPRQQQIIELRYLRDFTVKETAEILNIAEGTVGPTTTVALRRLKQILSGQIGSPKEETA